MSRNPHRYMKRLSVAMALALASFCAQGEPEVDCGPMGDCVIATETDETSAGYVATLNAMLPVPRDEKARFYLGIPEVDEFFKLNDLDTEILVVLVFDLYCHICSQSAPNMSKLEETLKEGGEGFDVRIIGLGRGDTQFEVDTFARKFKLNVPVFSDRSKELSDALGVKHTPSGYAFIRRGESFEEVADFSGYFNKAKLKEFTQSIIAVSSEN